MMGAFSRNKRSSTKTRISRRNLLSSDDDGEYGSSGFGNRSADCSYTDRMGWAQLSLDDVMEPEKPKSFNLTRGSNPNNATKWSSISDHSPVNVIDVADISFPNLHESPQKPTNKRQEPAANTRGLPPIGGTGKKAATKPDLPRQKDKGLDLSLHIHDLGANPLAPPSLCGTSTKANTTSEAAKQTSEQQPVRSPGSLLSRLTNSGHSRKVAKAQLKEKAERLESENEQLQKEVKKLKKKLAKKSEKLSHLEEVIATQAHQTENDPSNLYCQTSSYDVMKAQADLQVECFDKQLQEKNNKISSLENRVRDQEGRISYLEVLCLQNGIAIDEEQEKSADDRVRNPSYNESSDSCFGYSFACEDDDDEIWEEELPDETKNKLGTALGELEGPTQPASRDQDEVSIGITDLPRYSSSHRSSSKPDSWLTLDLGSNNASFMITSQHKQGHGMGLEEYMTSKSELKCALAEDQLDDNDTWAPKTVVEDALGKNAPPITFLSPVVEDKPTVPKPRTPRRSKSADDASRALRQSSRRSKSPRDYPRDTKRSLRRSKSPRLPSNPPKSPRGGRRAPQRAISSVARLEGGPSARISLNLSAHSAAKGAGTSRHHTGNDLKRTAVADFMKSPKPRDGRDKDAVLESLQRSLGSSMNFDAEDLPLPPPRQIRSMTT